MYEEQEQWQGRGEWFREEKAATTVANCSFFAENFWKIIVGDD
jgi:hypothetical protein